MTKKRLLYLLFEYLMLTLAATLYCAGWGLFMIPNGMSSGGLTGLCTVIQYATGGKLTVGSLYAIINAILLVAAFLVMGGKFGIKTIYCILLISVLLEFAPQMTALHSVEGNFLHVPERFLIPVISGLLEGVSLGIIFRHGGSTGGSDIIGLMIGKYWPVSMGTFFLVTDAIIVASLLLVPGRTFSDLVYGYIMIVISAVMVDMVSVEGRKSMQLMVISDRHEDIAAHIMYKMERGVTALRAVGCYTRNDKNVLLILLSQKEVHPLVKAIKDIDPTALISISAAKSVYGEGFEQIKAGL